MSIFFELRARLDEIVTYLKYLISTTEIITLMMYALKLPLSSARPARHNKAPLQPRILASHQRCQSTGAVSADKAWCLANVMACPTPEYLVQMQKVGFTECQADALLDLGKSDLKEEAEERRLMMVLIVSGFTWETATAIMKVKRVMMGAPSRPGGRCAS